MSLISRKSKASHVTSILKTSTLQSRLNESRTATKVRFQLPYLKKLDRILHNYVAGIEPREYEGLVVAIRDSDLLDSDVEGILSESMQCISILDHSLRLFVEALLSIKWTHRSATVVSEYQSFLLNLLSAHNYHTKYAIDKLVANFIPDTNEPEWNGEPSIEDRIKYLGVHWVFNTLQQVIPMSKDILVHSLMSNFPYLKRSVHTHEVYVYNMLQVLKYQPSLRPEILGTILSKLVLLDVNAPREVISQSESEEDEQQFSMDESIPIDYTYRMRHPIADSLDVCLNLLFSYIIEECHDFSSGELVWEKTKGLYLDAITIFDKVILPTYNTHHVQFALFYLCSFKTATTEAFLNYLWKKVCTPRVGSVLRQSAVGYIASLIARASFVTLPMLKGTLQQMAAWIHSYIASQDGNEYVNSDVRVHAVFYSVCQALFYAVAFRQKDLVNTKKNISFLESLNLAKIVTCKLNPLRVCQPAVVQNFATVTRTYQLAYCYSIMEHNARNLLPTIYQDEKGSVLTTNSTLEAIYPFDPYCLKRSGQKILPKYLHYQRPDNNESGKVHCVEHVEFEDDDFLSDNSDATTKKHSFSYGTSPGFKHAI